MHIYDQFGWIERSVLSQTLIYVGIQCLLGYSISESLICEKLTSSVNDVKCSNAVVSEFMNEVYDIIDITIFDFTVPWVFSFETP